MELKLFIKCHFTVVVTYEDAVSAQFSLVSVSAATELQGNFQRNM